MNITEEILEFARYGWTYKDIGNNFIKRKEYLKWMCIIIGVEVDKENMVELWER